MNSCILMAEITNPPQLRHTPDGLELTEMMVQFPGSRPDDPPAMLRVIGWGNMAAEIHQNYHQGDRVLIEGRLGMNTIQREGFKEKRAELTVQKIHSLGNAEITTSAPPQTERTPAQTNTRTNSAPANNTPPSYEPPAATPAPAPARTNVGVMPDNKSAPQPRYEPSTYPAMDDEPDMDDIPF